MSEYGFIAFQNSVSGRGRLSASFQAQSGTDRINYGIIFKYQNKYGKYLHARSTSTSAASPAILCVRVNLHSIRPARRTPSSPGPGSILAAIPWRYFPDRTPLQKLPGEKARGLFRPFTLFSVRGWG
jgi:hypothetical protein